VYEIVYKIGMLINKLRNSQTGREKPKNLKITKAACHIHMKKEVNDLVTKIMLKVALHLRDLIKKKVKNYAIFLRSPDQVYQPIFIFNIHSL